MAPGGIRSALFPTRRQFNCGSRKRYYWSSEFEVTYVVDGPACRIAVVGFGIRIRCWGRFSSRSSGHRGRGVALQRASGTPTSVDSFFDRVT